MIDSEKHQILNNEEENNKFITIDFKQESYTFEKDTYKKSLKPHISREDYDKIISYCSKIVGCALIKKKNNDTIKFPKSLILSTIISTSLIFVFFGTLTNTFLPDYNEVNNNLYITSVVCVSIAISINLLSSFYNYFRPIRKFHNLSYFIKIDIEKYFKEVNQKYTGKLFFEYCDFGSEKNRHIDVRVV